MENKGVEGRVGDYLKKYFLAKGHNFVRGYRPESLMILLDGLNKLNAPIDSLPEGAAHRFYDCTKSLLPDLEGFRRVFIDSECREISVEAQPMPYSEFPALVSNLAQSVAERNVADALERLVLVRKSAYDAMRKHDSRQENWGIYHFEKNFSDKTLRYLQPENLLGIIRKAEKALGKEIPRTDATVQTLKQVYEAAQEVEHLTRDIVSSRQELKDLSSPSHQPAFFNPWDYQERRTKALQQKANYLPMLENSLQDRISKLSSIADYHQIASHIEDAERFVISTKTLPSFDEYLQMRSLPGFIKEGLRIGPNMNVSRSSDAYTALREQIKSFYSENGLGDECREDELGALKLAGRIMMLGQHLEIFGRTQTLNHHPDQDILAYVITTERPERRIPGSVRCLISEICEVKPADTYSISSPKPI